MFSRPGTGLARYLALAYVSASECAALDIYIR